MAIYTVSLTDGTTLANLAVAAGRGPKGDGFTGVTFDNTTKTFTFTSNDGLGFTSDPITIDLLADPTPQLGGNLDLNSNDITGTGDINITGGMTLTGAINGPSAFTIDPAGHGDNTGTVIIAGNLQVDGTTTTINSQTLDVADLNITVASGAADAASADGAGLTVDGANATLTYVAAGDKWSLNKPLDVTGTVTADGLTLGGNILRDVDTSSVVISGGNAAATGANAIFYGSTSGNVNDILLRRNNVKFAAFDGATGDISFYEDTGTTPKFFWDASAESLGIGTSSPSPVGSRATVNVSSSAGAAIRLSDDTGNMFIDYTDTSGGRITVGAAEPMTFSTNSAERMRIDGSGNVGIGVVPETDWWGSVVALQINSGASISDNGAPGGRLAITQNARQTASGYITGWKYQTTDEAAQYLQIAGGHVWNTAPSGTADAAVTWSERMRITPTGHAIIPAGITLGTAAGVYSAANTLDDYEEGTFTATLTGQTTAPTTAVTAAAFYTKVGNLVNISLQFVNKDTTGAVGNMQVTGLPFVSKVGAVSTATPMTFGLSVTNKYMTSLLPSGANTISFYSVADAAAWTQETIVAGTTKYLYLNISYQATA